MGCRTRSNEMWVGTPDGVIRCRTIHRKPVPERFEPKYLSFKGTPWDLSGKYEKDAADPIPMRPDHLPRLQDPSAVPDPHDVRSFKIYKTDLQKHGYTPKCPGCMAMRDVPGPMHGAPRPRAAESAPTTSIYSYSRRPLAVSLCILAEAEAQWHCACEHVSARV